MCLKNDYIKPHIDSVLIDLVNICNYRCKFCWYHLDPKFQFLKTYRDNHFLFPLPKLFEFICDLEKIKVKNLTITSEGEPTLHPDIGKIIKYIKDNTSIKLKMQTNGTYPNSLKKDILLLDEVYINLSFFTKRVFNTLNPGIKFNNDVVIANIKDIKTHKKRPKIIIVYILTRYNLSEIKNALRSMNELGIDRVEFKPCEIVCSVNEDLMFNKKEAKQLALELLKQREYCNFDNNILEVAVDLTKNFYGKEHFKNNPKISSFGFSWRDWREKAPEVAWCESDYILRSPDLKACFYPLKYLYLRLNGELYTCPRNSWIDPVGNIFEKSLIDILNSNEYKAVVKESIFNFDVNRPPWLRCKNCFDAEYHRRMFYKIKEIAPHLYKKIMKNK